MPSASESGILRRGFFTSPAVKVMLFQASAENSEPTCTTARITTTFTSTMGPPTPTCTGCSELHPAFLQNSLQLVPKFAASAVALRPTVKASRIRPASDRAFAVVKMFCISEPSRTPKQFTMARVRATTMAVRLTVLTPISILPSTIGPTLSAGTWAMCHSQ